MFAVETHGRASLPKSPSKRKKAVRHLAGRSPFLKKVCGEFRANGHISERQAEAVRKAIARLDAAP